MYPVKLISEVNGCETYIVQTRIIVYHKTWILQIGVCAYTEYLVLAFSGTRYLMGTCGHLALYKKELEES